MGVGKTTIGKKLARALLLEFVDLDVFISVREGASISNIINSRGEDYFRILERDSLLELAKRQNVLVSTGGGVPCYFNNMEVINGLGTSVYLKMNEKSLVNRLVNNTESRPLIQGMDKDELLTFVNSHLGSRLKFYEQAHIEFDVLSFNSSKLKELAEKIKLI